MADLATLRRRRDEAKLALLRAEVKSRHKGKRLIAKARRRFIRATAAILEAELNRRIAAPLLRAQAAREQTGDLFSLGA